jgi:hypothetical protein
MNHKTVSHIQRQSQAIHLRRKAAGHPDTGGQEGVSPLHGSNEKTCLALNPMFGCLSCGSSLSRLGKPKGLLYPVQRNLVRVLSRAKMARP